MAMVAAGAESKGIFTLTMKKIICCIVWNGVKMTKRKTVNVRLGEESFYDILDQRTPEEVMERMKELQAGYPDRHVYFNVSGYGYDGGMNLELWESREETDKEFNKRVAEEKKEREKKAAATKAKKDKEFAEYVRLQKKFGDISYLDKWD